MSDAEPTTKPDRERTLGPSRPAPAPIPPHLQYLAIHTPDGAARVRQLQPEQKASILLRHFADAELDRDNLTADTAAQQHALRILLRSCLVGADSPLLKYPGDRGYLRLQLWRTDTLLEIARRAAEFNGI